MDSREDAMIHATGPLLSSKDRVGLNINRGSFGAFGQSGCAPLADNRTSRWSLIILT